MQWLILCSSFVIYYLIIFFFFFFSIYIASTNGLQKQGFTPSCFSIDDSILNFNQYGWHLFYWFCHLTKVSELAGSLLFLFYFLYKSIKMLYGWLFDLLTRWPAGIFSVRLLMTFCFWPSYRRLTLSKCISPLCGHEIGTLWSVNVAKSWVLN